jgi:hypothetical protein
MLEARFSVGPRAAGARLLEASDSESLPEHWADEPRMSMLLSSMVIQRERTKAKSFFLFLQLHQCGICRRPHRFVRIVAKVL